MSSRRFFWALVLPLLTLSAASAVAQAPKAGSGRDAAKVIPMRERVEIMQRFWEWKKENVLPMVMREQGIDMWIIRNDEEPLYRQTSYREHPVFLSLLPANHEGMVYPSTHEGSRSSVPELLMFFDTGDKIEYVEPRDFAHITELVVERDPKVIAVSKKNVGIRRQEIGDTSQYTIVPTNEMEEALGSTYTARTVDSWTLGIRWLSTASPEQVSLARYVQAVHNDILAEAFSNKVVVPNVTTTDDLNWWLRDKYLDLHIEIDNHPSITLKRRPSKIAEYATPEGAFRNGHTRNGVNVIIRRGDVISCDSDIMLLGLETDSHQHGYVLQKGETDVPEDLKNALRIVNDMQDAYRKEFKFGRTSAEIREATSKLPRDPLILSTASGFHPPPMFIRRFTENGLLFSRGTYVTGVGRSYKQHPLLNPELGLHLNTFYAFEPHTTIKVPGWGEQGLEIGVGQITVFTENGLEYLDRAQTEWHVIK